MKTRTLSTALFAGALALFATAQANAVVSVSFELVNPGGAYPGGPPAITFVPAPDSSSLYNFPVFGSVPNVNRSPFDDPAGNPTANSAIMPYGSVQAGGTATWNRTTLNPGANPTIGISFLWGSPDFFNKVEFFDAANVSLGSVSSNNLTNPNRNPPQDPATGQSWVIVLAGTTAWDHVTFTSTTNAFEFTSLGAACSPEGGGCGEVRENVPLPAALPLFVGGLGFVGFLARRRKQKAA